VVAITGAFNSHPSYTRITAKPSAQASTEAREGVRQPGLVTVRGAAPFTLHYPKGWRVMSAAQLAKAGSGAAAGIVSEGGRAVLLVRPKKPLTQPISKLSEQLTRSLSSRFTDFKLLSVGTTTTLAGPAWVYTFERSRVGLVQSEVVVSTKGAAYEIDVALHAGADRAASQIGEIIHSFED
jgi:hypothetical protein